MVSVINLFKAQIPIEFTDRFSVDVFLWVRVGRTRRDRVGFWIRDWNPIRRMSDQSMHQLNNPSWYYSQLLT